MKELLNKISSYNLFNYLFPGVIFSMVISRWSEINLIQDDIVTGLFFYYFIGLVISRFGSLIIEPILKWINFVKFANYSDFVKASKKDQKLEILSESNNMYRTLISLFLIILLSKIYLKMTTNLGWGLQTHLGIITVSVLILFLFSYRKQTSYITKRIKSDLE